MATTDTPVRETPNLDVFAHHWQDEADAAYLYRILSGAERDPHKKDLYLRLAEVEDRHVQVWANLMREYGREPKAFSPTARTTLLARLGSIFGPGFLLPMLLREEGREVKGYLDMHRSTPKGMAGASESLTLAKESADHAQTLNTIAGKTGEPWHRTESGGFLRNVVSLLTLRDVRSTAPAVAAPLLVTTFTFAASVTLPAALRLTMPPVVLMSPVSGECRQNETPSAQSRR